jgi:hypothetical protein
MTMAPASNNFTQRAPTVARWGRALVGSLRGKAFLWVGAFVGVLWALVPWYFYYGFHRLDHADPAIAVVFISFLPMMAALGSHHRMTELFPLSWVAISSAFDLACVLSLACFAQWCLDKAPPKKTPNLPAAPIPPAREGSA